MVDDYIEIPRELVQAQHQVTLCLDVMKVNGPPFLTTISQNLYYRTAQWVKHQTTDVFKTALESIFRVYNLGGFRVTQIRCDNEFRALMDPLANEFQVTMNYANPQEHVPEAERNNRVIKERVRATYHRLPYNHLPRLLVKTLVMESAKKLNFFPAKNGVSLYFSPRMILHQRTLDYNKHCKYPTGTYVQAHDKPNPTNTTAPRTLDCIYLHYNNNQQGGHELLHLPTNQLITRRTVTPIPITPAIIKQVHQLAEHDGMPKGLKITNRVGHVLFDNAWIAGVDYAEEEFDDEDYESSNEDETNNENDDDLDEEFDQMEPDEIIGLGEPEYNSEDDEEVATVEEIVEEIPTGVEEEVEEHEEELAKDSSDEDTDDDDEEKNNDAPAQDEEERNDERVTQSGRISCPLVKYTMQQCHLQTQLEHHCSSHCHQYPHLSFLWLFLLHVLRLLLHHLMEFLRLCQLLHHLPNIF